MDYELYLVSNILGISIVILIFIFHYLYADEGKELS
ncbi:dolichyl-diphosphooligosaccharide--protein glycosyltransferase subunit OST4, putative [Plasmodium knowlesi strain H]|uniref:Dolichyl-diphosphooligosaccharide--protein glycosyltransferase subunit OST4, putative n=1 Tax=Plasmodium knowlesi (strain H) TaxID=5851 RepID=A0A679L7Z8_PLAKH|nr:dolichyl-diphosphooligosaccharide--protein glycosyltransferase subunit OST4, putative [Plasmodium knowlesi strain H]CAA9991121.1 dolichyl-diphosphooligosaccharide--protein glycosyltransferase subunit OST4, putative [Plasmodium knowlesi strain H]VVS80595.1 dolichyl-diphosphooligosaccharide--protein glycosyltransferase subunit OST4, putative [Plasmodium knowlesi strain H]